MKNYPLLYLFILALTSHYSFSQYSISGHLDTPEKNKRVYLSLLEYDEQRLISKKQVIASTLTDSTGYFSLEGSLLPEKSKLYRIHANVEENSTGLQIATTDEIKNYHNFIFSNSDTIVFEKSPKFWFSKNENSNVIDEEWSAFNGYKRRLRREFSGTNNPEAKSHSATQFLAELKAYASIKQTHPLTTLLLLSENKEAILQQDYQSNSDFYHTLRSELIAYYGNTSYALQYTDLLSRLSITETLKESIFYKRTTYVLSAVCFGLLIIIVLLWRQLKKSKRQADIEAIPLTNQEEKVAELIIQEKSNKEIASELFISLSTVKTHVRNLYTKLEVNNRQEFSDKFKNHPRD